MSIVRRLRSDEISIFTDLLRQFADEEAPTGRAAMTATETDLREAIFGRSPMLNVLVRENHAEILGIASWCERYAPWTGKKAMWLADLYVVSAARRQGHARALLNALTDICTKGRYCRIEWKLFARNDTAKVFYESIGGQPSDMELWEL